MNYEMGEAVIVPFGSIEYGQMHFTGRVLSVADADQFASDETVVWLDVNFAGNHLAQMYRESELMPFDRPSELLAHGLCPGCLGGGLVTRPLLEGQGLDPCSTCHGVGRLVVAQTLQETRLGCELCQAALQVRLNR